jgi:hypothetical protein
VAARKALGADNRELFQCTLPMPRLRIVRIQRTSNVSPLRKMPLYDCRVPPATTYIPARQPRPPRELAVFSVAKNCSSDMGGKSMFLMKSPSQYTTFKNQTGGTLETQNINRGYAVPPPYTLDYNTTVPIM